MKEIVFFLFDAGFTKEWLIEFLFPFLDFRSIFLKGTIRDDIASEGNGGISQDDIRRIREEHRSTDRENEEIDEYEKV
jgi:hypothetical protein